MSTGKKVLTRIQNKHDLETNWNNATFAPLPGELIVYDKEVDNEGNITKYERFKIGDGSTPINDLHFSIDANQNKAAYEHSLVSGENPHGVTKQMLEVYDTYTNNEALLQDIGGIKASDHPNGFNNVPITDLITELLYPYKAPNISSFSLDPSASVKEKNVIFTCKTATVSVEKKTKPIERIELYRGTERIKYETNGVANGVTNLQFSINEELKGSTNTTYTVAVVEQGAEKEAASKSLTYTFVYPYFYGVINKGTTITSENIWSICNTFNKDVANKGQKKYKYTTNNQCPVIVYPKAHKLLSSIIDPNNFSQTWDQYLVTINNGTTIKGVEYYVYVGGASTASNVQYTFNHQS